MDNPRTENIKTEIENTDLEIKNLEITIQQLKEVDVNACNHNYLIDINALIKKIDSEIIFLQEINENNEKVLGSL